MSRYILRRVLIALALVWVVLTIIFVLVRLLPGDAALAMVGNARPEGLSPEQRAFMLHEMGLDRPLYVQYVEWFSKLAYGDLGTSLSSKRPVMGDVMVRIPRTLELAVASLILGLILGLPAGIASAVYRNTWLDVLLNGLLIVLGSLPVMILGTLLLLVFGLHLHWVPTAGFVEVQEDLGGHLRLLLLPTVTLGLWLGAVTARMTRNTMLEVLSQDYIRTAFSKGLASITVYRRHALQNALIPVVATVGLQVGSLLGGAVLTETVFSWPGLGSALVSAVDRRDYPVIQGILIITVTAFVFTNLVVDILITYLDPRIAHR